MFQRAVNKIRVFLKSCDYRKHGSHKVASSCTGSPCEIEFDNDYIFSPANRDEILENLKGRNSTVDVKNIFEIYEQLNAEFVKSKRKTLLESLRKKLLDMPNRTHPLTRKLGTEPRIIKSHDFSHFTFEPKEFTALAKDLGMIRMEELTQLSIKRSYYLIGDFAELEHALVRSTLSRLCRENFKLVSVPDIVPAEVVEACGMITNGVRTQVFQLDPSFGENKCLSGTSEIALASLYRNSVLDVKDLPVCLTAVSRCHRAELSEMREEKGLYRVHSFTKVEMFGLSHPQRSDELVEKFVGIQEAIFTSLGLDFHVLEMPMNELGQSSYRKIDIEAKFPGRMLYGEISSCSSCTDYQSRRLNIKFKDGNKLDYVHTVNGTACAVPRTLMALCETHQLENGNIRIPDTLQRYFNGRKQIERKIFSPDVKKEAEVSNIQ